jgi:hypothetical protein
MKYKWLLFLIMPIPAFADELLISNVPNGCSNSLRSHTYLRATFTRNQYQCNPGYYLPANTDHCVVCPQYYDCAGGTFTFNEYADQGNKLKTQITTNISNGCRKGFTRAVNNSANIKAMFVPNVHTCSFGYYLPANVDGCTACPEHTICSGGTYTFNETISQGITGCDNGYSLQNNVCVANTITINWSDTDPTDIDANNAGSVTYGGDIRTPRAAISKPGKQFKGWKFTRNS